MSELVLPDPGGDSPEEPSRGERRRGGRAGAWGGRREHRVLSEQECLDALGRLPGLLALGIIKAAQVNAIRGIYREILQHHQHSQAREDRQGISNADVAELMRTNPAILSMLEPLLTDEQIAMVMGDLTGDGEDE
jgi:hypothetical protein